MTFNSVLTALITFQIFKTGFSSYEFSKQSNKTFFFNFSLKKINLNIFQFVPNINSPVIKESTH